MRLVLLLPLATHALYSPSRLGYRAGSPAHGPPRCHPNVMITTAVEPTAELSATDVVRVVCEGLMNNDDPKPDAGLERLYHFMNPRGRLAFAPTPPKSGLQGGVTLEYFLEKAGNVALGALIFCASVELVGEVQLTPSSRTRGALATQLIEVGNSPLVDDSDAVAALRSLVSAPDDFLGSVITAVREGRELPEAPPSTLIKRRFWVQLEQERRPPLQDCWLIKEMLSLEKTKFQMLNEGGEEFEGADSK